MGVRSRVTTGGAGLRRQNFEFRSPNFEICPVWSALPHFDIRNLEFRNFYRSFHFELKSAKEPASPVHRMAATPAEISEIRNSKFGILSAQPKSEIRNQKSEISLVLANERPADVVAFERAVVEFFLEAADLLGVPKSVAVIYGLFFATPQPMCFAEVEGRLDISKGSVSQGLRVLREVGALKAVVVDDDRREFFVPDLELRKLILRWLDQRLKKQLDDGGRRLSALERAIPGVRTDTEVLRKRLKQLKGWHGKARALLPLAKTFLVLGS